MTEYDNTNRGATFPPFPTQNMILQGKLNVEGHDKKIVLVRDQTKSGKVVVEVYQKVGVLFPNDKKQENQPDYTGPISEVLDMDNEKRLAGWKKMKDGKPFLTLSVSDKGEASAASQEAKPVDDVIPF